MAQTFASRPPTPDFRVLEPWTGVGSLQLSDPEEADYPFWSSSSAAVSHAGITIAVSSPLVRHASAIALLSDTARASALSRCRLRIGLRGLNPLQPDS